MVAGDQLGQITPLLLVAAPAAQLVDAQVRMRAVGQADRSGSPRDLLHCQAVLEIAEPGSAVLLLDRDAVQAEGAHCRPELARKTVLAIDPFGKRRDPVAGKSCNAGAQEIGGFA